jgi:hypothetical protein
MTSSKHWIHPLNNFIYAFKVVKLFLKHSVHSCTSWYNVGGNRRDVIHFRFHEWRLLNCIQKSQDYWVFGLRGPGDTYSVESDTANFIHWQITTSETLCSVSFRKSKNREYHRSTPSVTRLPWLSMFSRVIQIFPYRDWTLMYNMT